MATELSHALHVAATTNDANQRRQAEEYLTKLEQQNFAQYVHALCIELGSKDRSREGRQLAGMNLKNALAGRSEQAQLALTQRWIALPQQTRAQVKAMMLQILHDPDRDISKIAAIVIGKLASIEIPAGEWKDLVPALDQNITKQSANVALRQSSLEALGYVCEECPDRLVEFAPLILGAIASGMQPQETDENIKFAATSCLVNSIEFIKGNMQVERDRRVIMDLVFAVCKSTDTRVRVAAFQCMSQIADNYYEFLPEFLANIFALTTGAINNDDEDEDVAQQAIEVWSTIADVEIELHEQDEHHEGDIHYKSKCLNIIVQAVPSLVPVLLKQLTKQNEDPEEDEWSTALSAGTCLGLLTQVAKDVIVPHVLPTVERHVNDSNWRAREAAILAFGCILDGPNPDDLQNVVRNALNIILSHMRDPHPLVKDTTAWTLGRICSLLPEVLDETNLPSLINALILGLSDTPKIASNVCWALHNLASAADVDDDAATAPLSKHFRPLMSALLQQTTRADVAKANLQVSLFECINILIQTAALDVLSDVAQLLPILIDKATQTVQQRPEDQQQRQQLNDIQAQLCGTLSAVVNKLDTQAVMPQSQMLVTLLLQILKTPNSTVHEEAIMAIGAVADKIGNAFVNYAPSVRPFILAALENAAEYRVCDVAVHATCDIARGLETNFTIQEWSDPVMKILLSHLKNDRVERTVKSHILACIGDIALAVAGNFDRYWAWVYPVLMQATNLVLPDEGDNYDYLLGLYEAIVDCYSGMLLGLNSDNKAGLFLNTKSLVASIGDLCGRIVAISQTPADNDRLFRQACTLVCDLIRNLGAPAQQELSKVGVTDLITVALNPKNKLSKATVSAANKAKKAVMGQA